MLVPVTMLQVSLKPVIQAPYAVFEISEPRISITCPEAISILNVL
jgi:hypothetical protein